MSVSQIKDIYNTARDAGASICSLAKRHPATAAIAGLALSSLVAYAIKPDLFSLTTTTVEKSIEKTTDISYGWFKNTTTETTIVKRTITKTPSFLGRVVSFASFEAVKGEEGVKVLENKYTSSSFDESKVIPYLEIQAVEIENLVRSSLQCVARYGIWSAFFSSPRVAEALAILI